MAAQTSPLPAPGASPGDTPLRTPQQGRRPRVLILLAVLGLLLCGGLLLRSLRLAWQPLWWDEGYSIYFATEPLARMGWLTARDIHPPLYYALLHGWLRLWGGASPEVARTLSILFGFAALLLVFWLARLLFPAHMRIALLSVLLLVFNPLHLFYSQEVRMYGLAMALGVASTGCLWLLVRRLAESDASRPCWRALLGWPVLGYVLCATAGLYTLYYTALLLLAHLVWALVALRRRRVCLVGMLAADFMVVILFSPWLAYAVPKLLGYVGNKVASDQDTPLEPLTYGVRHLAAFVGGHVQPPGAPGWLPWLYALLAVVVLAGSLRLGQRALARGVTALWIWLGIPLGVGWLINLRLPFFPEGGERLLLVALPYFCLLLAVSLERMWSIYHLGKIGLGALLGIALLGVTFFYTVPRYVAHDYRPIVRQMVQQGADGDTVLAIFPWQVGYWRAYAPVADPLLRGPQVALLADDIVGWSPAVAAVVAGALAQGAVWFPEPLTFGSTLPHEIESYLQGAAVNLENRWYDATRLTAWAALPPASLVPSAADFGTVQLLQAGVAPTIAASANQPVAVTLAWESRTPAPLNLSLRLRDGAGRVWASRETDLPWSATLAPGARLTETLGLVVPVGLPPGRYEVAASLAQSTTAGLVPLTAAGRDAVAVPVGVLDLVAPAAPQPLARLPAQRWVAPPLVENGLALVGATLPTAPHLAGTELDLRLFLQQHGTVPPARQIYVSLLDAKRQGVAGYAGWPLSDAPTTGWLPGALVQAPVSFFTPGTLPAGSYELVAGFVDPATGQQSAPAALGALRVVHRQPSFVQEAPPPTPLPVPAQVGTHVRLLGYALTAAAEHEATLQLYWEVLQPLLPPHHIFVHADGPDGTTYAQQDGPPQSAAGPAPTGSWQAGEFLVTDHRLQLPPDQDYVLRVGLYDPATGVRLPVIVGDQPAGDNVILPGR